MNDINDIINGKRSFPLHEQSGSQSSFAKNENVSGFALLYWVQLVDGTATKMIAEQPQITTNEEIILFIAY